MKLSLCIAAHNEEKFIHIPLNSAYDLVDEVILVDGGSADKTVEIVKAYGEKVVVVESDNPSMFHKNKQLAIERAKGEWILQLDADEALSVELKEEIKSVLIGYNQLKSAEIKSAYRIPRKNFFLNRFLMKGGQYPDYTIRLYKNGVAKFPCKNVHENVEINGGVGTLKFPILHFADPTFGRYLTRWNRYTSLDANGLIKKGVRPCMPCYFIGKPLYTFLNMYVRHLGILDGFPGFVFALFSSIRYWAIYVKWWQKKNIKSQP